MGKTRAVYGRFTRGLKPHEAPKGEGFTPEMWRQVDVRGKPILVEHNWKSPGAIGTFHRNWVEYDQKDNQHWCCIEGNIDLDKPQGLQAIKDLEAGKLSAWSVSLIQSNPKLVNDVGNNREFLEGSLTSDPAENGTMVLVRHNGEGQSVPVTSVPMKLTLAPDVPDEQQPVGVPEEKKKEEPVVAAVAAVDDKTPAPVATTAAPMEVEQKAADTLTKQEAQPVAPVEAVSVSETAQPPPPAPMSETAKATPTPAAASEQGGKTPAAATAAATTTTTTETKTPQLDLAVPTPKKAETPAPETEKKTKKTTSAEEKTTEEPAPKKKEEETPAVKKQPEVAKADEEMKDAPAAAENPIHKSLLKFANSDPEAAKAVVSLLKEMSESKNQVAKLLEEREAVLAKQEQARIAQAAEKHNIWVEGISKLVPDIPSDEKEIVRQLFESDSSKPANKIVERLVDRLTETIFNLQQQQRQNESVSSKKSARSGDQERPVNDNAEMIKQALNAISDEVTGKAAAAAAKKQEEELKRKRVAGGLNVQLPRELGPEEIMVRHSRVLSTIDPRSATARSLASFDDVMEVDVSAHHAALQRKIDEARLRKQQMQKS